MAQVTVKINGYSYTVGCEDGQEDHLTAMAEQVDGRIDGIKALGTNSGEARVLMLSALMMADEIHDLKVELEGARRGAPGKPNGDGKRMSKLAARAEQIAADLEHP